LRPVYPRSRLSSAKLLRKFLSQWLNNPSYYNYVKAVLSKVLETAVDEGLLERNPATDISNRRVPKRDVYLPDNDYIPIMQKLLEEWHVQTCELIYLVSHNPVDVLLLRDANDIKGNKIHITRSKTEQDVVIEMNEDLAATVEWFRRWKRRQGITSPYLICHPLDAPRRSMISQPVSVEYISRRFTQAAIAAGFKPGTYTLRDLRAKGLTDEFEIAGDSDKGGHKTEAMKRYYRRIKSPMRAKSNLNKKLS